MVNPLPRVRVLYCDSGKKKKSTCKHNNEAHSRNHYCRGKAVSTTSVSSLLYLARKTYAPFYTGICGLSGCAIFFHIIKKDSIFVKILLNMKCVLILSTPVV